MLRRMIRLSLVVWLMLWLMACNVTSSKPSIAIVSPPHGSQFHEGDTIAVQSTATDASGISRVELIVDGTIVRTDAPMSGNPSAFPVVQNWKATTGTHTVAVRAYNTAGMASDAPAVSILVAASLPATPVVVLPTTTPFAPPIPVTAPSPTPILPTTAPPPVACTNIMSFVGDITVPPGTNLTAQQSFDKIWRIRNDGTCTWDTHYELAFVGGEAMTTQTVVNVPLTAPASASDILVSLSAPSSAGTHMGQWQMRGPNGLFGSILQVSINVPSASSVPPGCPGVPIIDFFNASPSTITAGQTTTLMWGKVDNATSASINNGIGGIGTPGSTTVKPTATTTYVLTATGCGGTMTKQVTVTVNPSGPPLVVVPVNPILPLLPKGNLILQDVFLSTGNEVILRVANDPTGSLTGTFKYKIYANDVLVKEATVTIPTGSQAFWSGYVVSGTRTIKAVLDVFDLKSSDNEMTKRCNSASHSCY